MAAYTLKRPGSQRSFFLMGSGSGLLRAIENIRALDPLAIAPGHGDVCGPEVLDRLEDYVRFVKARAIEGVASGATPLEVAEDTDLGDFGALVDSERFVGNLHREYPELGGTEIGGPVDLPAALADMVKRNVGRPLHCVA